MQIMFLYQIDEVVTGNRVHFGKKYGRLVFPVHNLNRNGLTIEVYHSSYSSLCCSNTLSMYKMPLSTAHWFPDLHLNIQQHNNIISTVINQFLFSTNIVAYNNYNFSYIAFIGDISYDTYNISEFHQIISNQEMIFLKKFQKLVSGNLPQKYFINENYISMYNDIQISFVRYDQRI